MSLKVSKKEMEALLESPSSERYAYTIKRIVDWEEVWALYQDGWALAANDDGEVVFSLWPAKEYALLCAQGGWKDYEAASIDLDDLIEELLPQLKEDNIKISIFNTPALKGVVVEVDHFLYDLNKELEKY